MKLEPPKLQINLNLRRSVVDLIQSLESSLSPHDKSSQMTSRGKVEKIKTGDTEKSYSGQISKSFADAVVLFVDDKGSLAHGVTSVSDFANTGTDLKEEWLKSIIIYI